MFIKKDLRKIPTILGDASKSSKNDTHKNDTDTSVTSSLIDLCLQRRKAEFRGSVKILCQPSNAPFLGQLKSLSLYDCEINSLQGIGMLESLETLNVGRNPVKDLPDDFVQLQNLKVLWLDDCSLEGALPVEICKLEQLQELRVSNNILTAVPPEIQLLSNLRILGLDRNRLESIPAEIHTLHNLTHLLLRQNGLTQLPDCGDEDNITLPMLQILHVSSNHLTSLPVSLFQQCRRLTHVYANSNRLTSLDADVIASLSVMTDLQYVTLANNAIDYLPQDFWRTFQTPDQDGVCHVHRATDSEDDNDDNSKCTVVLRGNPVVQQNDPDNDNDSDPMDTSMDTPMAAETESQAVVAA
jgi:Leucine-rich repeat (LRR) protein